MSRSHTDSSHRLHIRRADVVGEPSSEGTTCNGLQYGGKFPGRPDCENLWRYRWRIYYALRILVLLHFNCSSHRRSEKDELHTELVGVYLSKWRSDSGSHSAGQGLSKSWHRLVCESIDDYACYHVVRRRHSLYTSGVEAADPVAWER